MIYLSPFLTFISWSNTLTVVHRNTIHVTCLRSSPEFGTGCHQVCEATSEADRDAWVAAIHSTALNHLAEKVRLLVISCTKYSPIIIAFCNISPEKVSKYLKITCQQ